MRSELASARRQRLAGKWQARTRIVKRVVTSTDEPVAVLTRKRARAGSAGFSLSGEQGSGIEILKIVEVIGVRGVTIVPHTGWLLRGLISPRGEVLPVVDLRAKVGLPGHASSQHRAWAGRGISRSG